MKIKLNELMILERILLEFDANHKFDLKFNDVYNLHEYLSQVGKITSFAFLIQDEHYNTFNNAEKLKAYHEQIMNSSVELHYKPIVQFIEHINQKLKDDKINEFIEKNKFW